VGESPERRRTYSHRILTEGGGQFVNIFTQGYVGFKYVLVSISTVPVQLPRCRRFDFGAAVLDISVSRFFTSIEPEFLRISLPHLPWPDLGAARHRGASCFPKTFLNKLTRWQDLR